MRFVASYRWDYIQHKTACHFIYKQIKLLEMVEIMVLTVIFKIVKVVKL